MEKLEDVNSLISIIVPVYNVQEYLPKCLDSIINQTYKNLEIILVNDGSTDNSGRICDEYAEKDSRIVVIHKVNGGVSSARNSGLMIAKGNYIGFVDPDDWIADDMYEILYKNIKKFNAYVSVCKLKYVNTRNESITNSVNINNTLFLDQIQSLKYLLDFKTGYSCGPCNKLYKKEVINKFNGNLSIAEDLLQNFEIYFNLQNVTVFEKIEKYFYYFRDNSASHSSTFSNARIEEIDVWKYILQEVANSEIFKDCNLIIISSLKRIIWYRLFELTIKNKKENINMFKKMKNENKKILKTLNEYSIKEVIYLILYYLPYGCVALIWKLWLWKKKG